MLSLFLLIFFSLSKDHFQIVKNVYALFTMLSKKRFQCWNIKLCESLVKVSNEIKQYVNNVTVRSH